MLLRLRGWARTLLRRDAVEREMQDEMQLHLQQAVERLMARGLSAEAARVEARREFGNVAFIQEQARDARGVRWLEDAAQDARYALRALRLKPGFALAVIATLALGVGANATMFSVVDRLLFRPPAYLIGPDRSHHVYFTRVVNGTEAIGAAYPYQRFLDLAGSSTTMEVVAAYSPMRLAIGVGEGSHEATMGAASASFWNLFDARPVIGRFFTADEDRDPDGARVAVLSYGYWQTRYAGSPGVLGTTIVITPARYTIIGVAPPGFVGVERETPSIFVPMAVAAVDEFGPSWNEDRTSYAMSWLEIYGRRKPGVTVARATADLSAAFRESYRKERAQAPAYTPPMDVARPRMFLSSVLAERGPRPSADGRVATWLFGVTAIVLLIACANVGNLLLARALSRRREIAVRLALGAGRARLVRHLLIESMVLALLGGFAGLLLAEWGGQLLRTFLLPDVEWQRAIADPRTLLFAIIATLVVGLFAGGVPVAQATRCDVIAGLKTGARDGQGRRSRLRGALLLAQVTLSVMLLIGAGLFTRSVDRVGQLRLGYDPDQLLVVDLSLRSTNLDSAGQVALRRALIERAERNPMVRGATLACSVPFAGTCSQPVFVAGVDSTNRLGEFVTQVASPAYFETVGTRILRGRGILPDDRAGGPLVAVVSEAMARALWPTRDAIGQCFRTGADTAPCRIVVGIAENVRQERIGDEAGFEYYIPAAQDGGHRGRLFVRVQGDPATQSDALRRDLTSVMPASAYLVVRPMTRLVGNVTRSWRLGAVMFTAFGVLAMVVAMIGLYSVVAYGVAQRRHEVGVRIALGAQVADIVRLVVFEGLRVVIVGTVLGMALALSSGRWLGPLLFRVSPSDPMVFAAVAIVLIGVALVASGLPALRASRFDPVASLRAD